MTLEEFREKYDGAPAPVEDVAQAVVDHLEYEEAQHLHWFAKRLLAMVDDFKQELEVAEVELG